MREIEEKKRGTADFWRRKIAEAGKGGEEKKEITEESDAEIDESEEEKEEEKRERAFFRCKEDREATCKQHFIDAQADTESKCMNYIKANMDVWKNGIFYTIQNGMYVAKREEEEGGKIIVPECLRAHVLKSFHNSY